jgi:hypothetical protein
LFGNGWRRNGEMRNGRLVGVSVNGLTSDFVTARIDECGRRDFVFKVNDDLDGRSGEDGDLDDGSKDHKDVLDPRGGWEVVGVLVSATVKVNDLAYEVLDNDRIAIERLPSNRRGRGVKDSIAHSANTWSLA